MNIAIKPQSLLSEFLQAIALPDGLSLERLKKHAHALHVSYGSNEHPSHLVRRPLLTHLRHGMLLAFGARGQPFTGGARARPDLATGRRATVRLDVMNLSQLKLVWPIAQWLPLSVTQPSIVGHLGVENEKAIVYGHCIDFDRALGLLWGPCAKLRRLQVGLLHRQHSRAVSPIQSS